MTKTLKTTSYTGFGFFQAILQGLPTLLIVIDRYGIICDYILGDSSLYYLKPENFLNKRIEEVMPAEVSNNYKRILHYANKSDEPVIVNYSLSLADGEHWYEARLISISPNQTALAIQETTKYKQAEVQSQRQLHRIAALRAIDQAIASGVGLKQTLMILLNQVINHLHVDAASILLLDPNTKTLEHATSIGFKTTTLKYMQLRLGSGYAGLAAQQRRVIFISDLPTRKTDFLRSPIFLEENFVCYYGIPLIAKGQVHGVLEIFNRSILTPEPEWVEFLETLGGQAAIAIDNAILFNDLQHTNKELVKAYDDTIEGWSRALDLRDHETEGHTKRVAQMTIRLAQRLGISHEEITHIHRGAILHDIGKMGIPDSILHKPGPLNEEEWRIMREHPRYAYTLLSPIVYLSQATEIPHYHHEKWDGTGYPYGLKGAQIPLAARLFAIIDVYDALTSDRPYRTAWSQEDTLRYIKEQSGKHFDPEIVSEFLKMISEDYSSIP